MLDDNQHPAIPSADQGARRSEASPQPSTSIAPPIAADVFSDLTKLRISQSFGDTGVRKVITRIPVRKPGKQEFVRVRDLDSYRLEPLVLITEDDRETYLVLPALFGELHNVTSHVRLFVYITRGGDIGVWPCKLPGPDGRTNAWFETALHAAECAMRSWVRVVPNMSLGAYELYEATGALGEPEWPDLSFSEILRIAFKDRVIDTVDHPVLRRLRGEL